MRWAVCGLFIIGVVLYAAEPRVRVLVRFDGKVIECYVPRSAENRWVTLGVTERIASTRELNEYSPYVHRLELRQLPPCEGADVLEAFCALEYGRGEVLFSRAHEPCTP